MNARERIDAMGIGAWYQAGLWVSTMAVTGYLVPGFSSPSGGRSGPSVMGGFGMDWVGKGGVGWI